MKLATRNNKGRVGSLRRPDAAARRPYLSGFTLAEVLAAMLFLAIVIPVAVEALHVSSLAGEVAARKGAAARIADRVLNESLVTTNWTGSGQSGTVSEGAIDYRWTLSVQSWPQAQNSASPLNSKITMEMLTAQVTFQAQGKDYTVKLNTLADSPNQAAAMLSLR
jgi:type II secretory pathway pseudopilin PulG